jgi:hypothetical protein
MNVQKLKVVCLSFALIAFTAAVKAEEAQIEVHADRIVHPLSRYLTGACIEDVNHEIYGGLYSQMIFGESFQEPPRGKGAADDGVSRMWRPFRSASVAGGFDLETQEPFVGNQSQRITFHGGSGEIGVENQGLNGEGMYFVEGKRYEGYIWARAEKRTRVFVSLESADGTAVYAGKTITVAAGHWQRFDFTLKPEKTDKTGRFAIKLKQPGSVVVGHAFLQPGGWGRFKGLPVRKDVAEALIDEGITVLRYGGSMVNAPGYRWQNMTGPRDRRPPYRGTWYPDSSNGWGIFDFLDFCEAAGFLGIPDLNIDEQPSQMADFVKYANAPAGSEWGRRRAADGHPAPFHLAHIELGNEEKVNEDYWRKFKPMAEAVWAADPDIILVVGDFFYDKVIADPFQFEGGAVPTLAAHKKILDLAREHGREVWFDIHIWNESPPQPGHLASQRSFIEQLDKISPGAKYKVAVFEFNANKHDMGRALATASAIEQVEQVGERLPVASSANCLQPDGQNDNGWNQGLLFLNPEKVWLQPPGYVTRMVSRNYQPLLVESNVHGTDSNLQVIATRSQDAKILVLQVINIGDQPAPALIHLDGFVPSKTSARVEQLAGSLDAANTAQAPDVIKPILSNWQHDFEQGKASYSFPPHSFTIIRIE